MWACVTIGTKAGERMIGQLERWAEAISGEFKSQGVTNTMHGAAVGRALELDGPSHFLTCRFPVGATLMKHQSALLGMGSDAEQRKEGSSLPILNFPEYSIELSNPRRAACLLVRPHCAATCCPLPLPLLQTSRNRRFLATKLVGRPRAYAHQYGSSNEATTNPSSS